MRKLLFAFVAGMAGWIAPAVQAQEVGNPLPPTPAQVAPTDPQPPAPGVVPTPALPGTPAPGVVPGPGAVIPGQVLPGAPYVQPGVPCAEPCLHTKKVCVPEPTTKKHTKVVYCSKCVDYCLKKCSFNCLLGGHGHHDEGCPADGCCSGHRCSWCHQCPDQSCACGCPRHKHVLLKKVVVESECPDFKCHVEEHVVEPKCHTKHHCQGAAACVPGGYTDGGMVFPGSIPPGTQVIPIGPPAGTKPVMPPATGVTPSNNVTATAGTVATPRPMPVAPAQPVQTVPVAPVSSNPGSF